VCSANEVSLLPFFIEVMVDFDNFVAIDLIFEAVTGSEKSEVSLELERVELLEDLVVVV
jgi:hypothetical protein